MYELIIKRAKHIEELLTDIGGTGSSLHDLATSLEDKLTKVMVEELRFIATIRNKALHEPYFELSGSLKEKFNSISLKNINKLQNIRHVEQRACVCICPHCTKPTIPLLTIYAGEPSYSCCAHCDEHLEKFNGTQVGIPAKQFAERAQFVLGSILVAFVGDLALLCLLLLCIFIQVG